MSRENWWLDYVEKEIDEATQAEMKALLRHSPLDQEFVKSISETKMLLKEFAAPAPEVSARNLDFLHDKIMARIEDKAIQRPPRFLLQPRHHRWMKSGVTSFILLATTLMIGSFVSNPNQNTQGAVSKQMAAEAQQKPQDLGVLMTYQTEHDFFVDVASLSLDHLTKEQFESFLRMSKTR